MKQYLQAAVRTNSNWHFILLTNALLSCVGIIQAQKIPARTDTIPDQSASTGISTATVNEAFSRTEATICRYQCMFSEPSGVSLIPNRTKIFVTGINSKAWWEIEWQGDRGTVPYDCICLVDSTLTLDFIKKYFREQELKLHELRRKQLDSINLIYEERALKETMRLDSIRRAQREENLSIGKSNYPLRIHDIRITNVNSAGGVEFQIRCNYFKSDKTIKYLHFVLQPYNAVGDLIECDVSAKTEFIGKVTGPIDARQESFIWTWESAWYNNTTACIRLLSVKVQYMDGSESLYSKELPKILGEYLNDCSYK